MATKTIGDYKKDYEAAKAAGDAAGMQAANDGANAIRASMGQAAQVASSDIQKVAQSGQSQTNGSVSTGTGSAPAYTSPAPVQANSAAGVNVNTGTQQSIKDQMNANSNAWWTATPEERARLEAENKSLAARLGSGVTFDAKTGTWSGTADQISVPQTQVNDYSSYLEDMYAAKKRSALAQLDNAYQKNVNAINRAGDGIGTQYQNARNQAAGASELAARNFNEYAAASGLNSGAGGQAELARNVALQNNLNDISTQESSTLADLELQRANAETEYNNAIAQAEATGDYELAAALYQEKVRVEEALINQQLQQFQMDLQKYQLGYQADRDAVSDSQWQQQFGYTTSQAEKENLAKYGSAFLEQGLMPSQEMLSAMGITAEDAQRYVQNVQLQAAMKAAGSSSGSSGSESSSNPANSDSSIYETMYRNGIRTEGEAYAWLLGKDYSSTEANKMAGYFGTYLSEGEGSTPVKSGLEMNPDHFRAFMGSINAQLNSGNENAAIGNLDARWSEMSTTQRAEMQALLKKFGLSYTP